MIQSLPRAMILNRFKQLSERQKQRSLMRRMAIVHGALLFFGLLIVARLMELQIISRAEYAAAAQSQHFGDVTLPAKRGDILALNSKNGETSILATNTTLDLVYVDPLIVDNPAAIADRLSDALLTQEFHDACMAGLSTCPREFVVMQNSPYAAVFDPMRMVHSLLSGSLLEPIPQEAVERSRMPDVDITEARRLFARDIERRISENRVTFVPLKYGATKSEMSAVAALNISGVYVNEAEYLVFANPEELKNHKLSSLAKQLAPALHLDEQTLADPTRSPLRSRPLRYVPLLRQLPPDLSLRIKEMKLESLQKTNELRSQAATRKDAESILDPLRCVALIPEHWRFYPDGTIASQVVGFLNVNQEAQYGIERTFDAQLRGKDGSISTVSDRRGAEILTADQSIIDPTDGDTVVLTIDPFIQRAVEQILDEGVREYRADSAQAIVMDPHTGRILAMVNAPLFERNSYADVFDKEPVFIPTVEEEKIVVEVYHPAINARVLQDYMSNVFSDEGRKAFSQEIQDSLAEIEGMYDLKDVVRYYVYEGEKARYEVFPTDTPNVWLKFKNTIGVGAYLNRTIQEIYEPGSVMKPLTIAVAIDQGEIDPDDIYNDTGPVEVDEYVIKNALLSYYGPVTMTNCLEFSINTCLTSVSRKLGSKLFHRMIERLGFGRPTNVELEDELSGSVKPWRSWRASDLATASFGHGFSSTPLQTIAAFSTLANGGKLMQPIIIDRIIHPDGTEKKTETVILDQVITEETAAVVTAMLESSANNGFAESGKVKGHRLAAKTGTSQIAAGARGYESGTGSTINTFMGYAPPDNPKFIVLVKFDRPKFKLKVFSEATAGPTFKRVAAFLYDYYGLPPDEE